MHPRADRYWVRGLGRELNSTNCVVLRSLALEPLPNGIKGTLELLVDKRLSPAVRDKLWGNGSWSFVFPPDSELYKEFAVTPPRKAILRIRASNRKLSLNEICKYPWLT